MRASFVDGSHGDCRVFFGKVIEILRSSDLMNHYEILSSGTKKRKLDRIEWVDIFKALTIISVVLGHTTGLYNMYIYQFHMAAFFFISGYTTNLESRGLFETIWEKFCTMILPLITVFLIMLGILFSLNLFLHGYEWNRPILNIDLKLIFQQFFSKGNIYISWLGATWFLIVLFGCCVIQKIIYMLSKNKVGILYISGSVLVFVLGYIMVLYQTNQYKYLDLIFIAQFYFFTGILFRHNNIFNKYLSNVYYNSIILLATIVGLYYFGIVNLNIVDYPSRVFGFIVTNYLAAINGIVFIFLLAYYLAKFPIRIKKLLSYIGQNTICIVFFHFIFFKVSYIILYYFGIVPLDYVQNFIPTVEVGSKYYILFVIVSISLSILTWSMLNKYKVMRILLGGEKLIYKQRFKQINDSPYLYKLHTIWDECKNGCSDCLCITKIFIKNHSALCISIASLIILICAPMMLQGIICNDELQRRFLRMQGFGTLISQGISMELAQGRPMRILAPMQNSLSYISNNIYVFRSFQILLILSNIGLFSYFIFKVFNNKKFALLTGIFALIFLPITFEHTLPNAFVGLVAMPMNFLLLSFICFIKYITNKSKNNLLLSMMLFFIAMLGYEFIVTFVLLYPVLYYAKANKEQCNPMSVIKHSVLPLVLAIVFIALTFSLQKLYNVGYDGAKLGFVSLESSFTIIWTLFKSSLPGYYLFNSKYVYLFNLYTNTPLPISAELIKQNLSGQVNIFDSLLLLGAGGMNWTRYILNNFMNARIILIILFLFFTLYSILQYKNRQRDCKMPKMALFVGLAYMIIPSLPNSLVKLYQGNVSDKFFTGLPVSYFLFFSAIFVFSCLIWELRQRLKSKYWISIIVIFICIYCALIQSMNNTFAQEQNKNYQRLVNIEQLFDTRAVQNMKNQSVYAPDLYVTKNLLSIHQDYFTQFAKFKNLNIHINNATQKGNEQFIIYDQHNEYFVLCGGDEVIVFSDKPLRGKLPVKVSEDLYLQGNFEQNNIDGKFYSYSFIKQLTDGKMVLVNTTTKSKGPFENLYKDIGSTLETAHIIAGYYADGWVEKESAFKIHTQNQGKIILKGYYPNEITGNEIVTIRVNGNSVKTLNLDNKIFQIEVAADANSDITVEISNNFNIVPSNADIRQLSFILSSAEGI